MLAWTNVFHRNNVRKLLGVLFSVGLMIFILGLNLALAHYRVFAHTMEPDAAMAAAWSQLFSREIFAISDIKSAGMVAMGILFSFIAMVEGYIWRDPYPGYAAITSHLHAAEDAFHDEVDDKIAALKDVQTDFVDKIKAARAQIRDKRQQIPIVLGERKRLISRFSAHIAHLQDVGRSMLATYRTANMNARGGTGPKRFQEGSWVLDGFDKIETDDDIWQAPDSEWQEANDALETSIDRLQTAYETALSWIRAQDARKPEINAGGETGSGETTKPE
jgi:hypothetical protein